MRNIEGVLISAADGVCDTGPGYLQLPKEMAVYSQPHLPDDPLLRQAGMVWLPRLEAALSEYSVGGPSPTFNLKDATREELRFLGDMFGRGEINAVAMDGSEVRVEESAFPGLWRVQELCENGDVGADRLEVAGVPSVLSTRARAACVPMTIPERDAIPADVVNAPHIFAELLDRSRSFESSRRTHTVNLDLVPMGEAELGWLVQTLGEGPVVILSSGYGACRIRSTMLAGAWWVQYFNSSDALILNTLEITDVPAVACAADDDIAESAARLRKLKEVLA